MSFFSKFLLKLFPFLRQCQSCGFTLSKDEHKGGTQSDGSRSIDFCSICFWDGQFIHPDSTPEQALERHSATLIRKGMPIKMVDYVIPKIKKEIHTYKRWK